MIAWLNRQAQSFRQASSWPKARLGKGNLPLHHYFHLERGFIMRNITVEKVLLLVITFVLLYVMFFAVKIVDHQNKCMAAIVADLLSGNIIQSQVSCSGAIK